MATLTELLNTKYFKSFETEDIPFEFGYTPLVFNDNSFRIGRKTETPYQNNGYWAIDMRESDDNLKLTLKRMSELVNGIGDPETFTYYVLSNTVDEYGRTSDRRYISLQTAEKAMETASDYYRDRGTGTIYKVTLDADSNGALRENKIKLYSK